MSDVKFKEKVEHGYYKVWVYMEGFNSPVTLLSERCKASSKRKCKKLKDKALQVCRYYQDNQEWKDAL